MQFLEMSESFVCQVLLGDVMVFFCDHLTRAACESRSTACGRFHQFRVKVLGALERASCTAFSKISGWVNAVEIWPAQCKKVASHEMVECGWDHTVRVSML